MGQLIGERFTRKQLIMNTTIKSLMVLAAATVLVAGCEDELPLVNTEESRPVLGFETAQTGDIDMYGKTDGTVSFMIHKSGDGACSVNVTGMTVLNNFTSVYGADAVAAMGIAQKVNMVPMYISQGLSQGFMPLISYNYASGNTRRMKDALIFVVKLAMPFMVLVSLGYYLFADSLVAMFMNNQAIIDYGAKFLHGFCLALPFLCMDFVAVGVFQACGMGSRALVFAILRKIVLEIPALYLLNRLFPLYGLSYAQFVTEVILAAAAVITLMQIFRKLDSHEKGGRTL